MYRHLLSLALSLLLAGCQIDIDETRSFYFLCNQASDCSSGFVCQANPAAEVQGAVGYCVSAVLATESDASDASDSSDVSDVSDTADSSDASDTSDPSDSSETSDPTDPASGCADPLAVNQNTPDPCTYDDLSDGISNAGFEIGCGEDGNRLDGWNTTSTDAEVFIATTGERFITAPDIDDGEARFSAFNGNHAARLSNRNNGERTEGGIYQERSLSNIQAPALLMGAMVRYSPFDPIDEYARAQIRLSYHERSGELPRVSTWLDITERVDDQAWTQIWHCATRTAGENFAQLGVRLTTPSGGGTGTLYVDNVGFWEISECPTDLDALSADELSRYNVAVDPAATTPSFFDGNQCREANNVNACPGPTGLMDCAEGEEANYPPNANPTCESSGQEGISYCSLQCDPGFIVPDTLYNTCVNPESSLGMAIVWDGTYPRGCSSCDVPQAKPTFDMEVNAYEIDITEVTVAAYRACYNNGEGPCTLPDGGGTFSLVSNDDKPVTNVTWQQAMMYCVHNNKRLPTEAEWEAAARLREADGSRVVSDYPWGNSDVDCARAVLDQAGCGSDEPQSVGTTPRGHSHYGVADLTGNVREWVFDRYQADTYENNLQDRGAFGGDNNANLPEAVIRGGSFATSAGPESRGWYRAGLSVNGFATDLGFRCARLRTPRDVGGQCIFESDCSASTTCSVESGRVRGTCVAN